MVLACQMPQPLGHVRAHGQAQPGFIARTQGGKNKAVVLRHIAAAQFVVKGSHGGAKL